MEKTWIQNVRRETKSREDTVKIESDEIWEECLEWLICSIIFKIGLPVALFCETGNK